MGINNNNKLKNKNFTMKYQSIYIAAALAASSYAKTIAHNVEVEPEAPLKMIINYSHEVDIQDALDSRYRADMQLLKVYHSQDCDGKALYSIKGDGEETEVDGLTPVYDDSYYQQYFNDFSVELPPRTLLQIYNGVLPFGGMRASEPETLLASYFNEEEVERVCVNFNKSEELKHTLLPLALKVNFNTDSDSEPGFLH